MTHTDEQLEPCPCCRAIPQTHCDYKCFDRGSTPGWQIRCDNCGLQTCWWHSLADAIEKWSKRISPASAAPTVDAEKQAQDLVDAFRFASPPVQSLRFLEWEPLVAAIASALRGAAATAAPVEQGNREQAIHLLRELRETNDPDERTTKRDVGAT